MGDLRHSRAAGATRMPGCPFSSVATRLSPSLHTNDRLARQHSSQQLQGGPLAYGLPFLERGHQVESLPAQGLNSLEPSGLISVCAGQNNSKAQEADLCFQLRGVPGEQRRNREGCYQWQRRSLHAQQRRHHTQRRHYHGQGRLWLPQSRAREQRRGRRLTCTRACSGAAAGWTRRSGHAQPGA